MAGDPSAARAAGQEGCDLADSIGDRFDSRLCRWCIATAQLFQGDLVGAAAQFGAVSDEAEAAHDPIQRSVSLAGRGYALAYRGDASAARAAADEALEAAGELGGTASGFGYSALATAALAAGDVATALDATEAAGQHHSVLRELAATQCAQAALATATGWHLMVALMTRARVAIAQGEPVQAERDAHDALAIAAEIEAHLVVSDTLECLATLAGDANSHREAARLFGAAHAIRQRIGEMRFKIWEAGYEASVAALRDAMGEQDFDSAWVEGAGLSTEEAIAYAQRGRGERKRPTSGWGALTPTERDVVRLVSEGLGNKDIATRLFVSPRTVQSHLTHVYTKLGLTSRVQLVQEGARHA